MLGYFGGMYEDEDVLYCFVIGVSCDVVLVVVYFDGLLCFVFCGGVGFEEIDVE